MGGGEGGSFSFMRKTWLGLKSGPSTLEAENSLQPVNSYIAIPDAEHIPCAISRISLQ